MLPWQTQPNNVSVLRRNNVLEASYTHSTDSTYRDIDRSKYIFHGKWTVIYVFMEINMVYNPLLYVFIAVSWGYLLLLSLSDE